MTNSVSVKDTAFWLPWTRVARRDETQYDALTFELQAAHAREEALLREKSDLLQRQDMLAQEFEHRLINSLQIIVSLLSLQSRRAGPDAAAQLTIAANRVASFGRVHRALHLLDHQENVEFKQYLQQLCEDLSGLLFRGGDCMHDRRRGCDNEYTNYVRYPPRLCRQRANYQFSKIRQEQHHRAIGNRPCGRSLTIGAG